MEPIASVTIEVSTRSMARFTIHMDATAMVPFMDLVLGTVPATRAGMVMDIAGTEVDTDTGAASDTEGTAVRSLSLDDAGVTPTLPRDKWCGEAGT
jgi:hypothetical protein